MSLSLFHYYAKFLTHAKLNTGIVAHSLLNVCEEVHQFLLSIFKQMHTQENCSFFLPHGVYT